MVLPESGAYSPIALLARMRMVRGNLVSYVLYTKAVAHLPLR